MNFKVEEGFKSARAHLQQQLQRAEVSLAHQHILLGIVKLVKVATLDGTEQCGGKVGVLVDGALPLCQFRQRAHGCHQTPSVLLQQSPVKWKL